MQLISRILRWLLGQFFIPPRPANRFRFFDGCFWRDADPLKAYDALKDRIGNTHREFIANLREETLVDAVCEAFHITRYDAATCTGLTRNQMLRLIIAFSEFVANIDATSYVHAEQGA